MFCVQGLARLQSWCSSLSCDSDRSSLVRRARRVLSCVPHVVVPSCVTSVTLRSFCALLCHRDFPGWFVGVVLLGGWRFAVSVVHVVGGCQVGLAIVFRFSRVYDMGMSNFCPDWFSKAPCVGLDRLFLSSNAAKRRIAVSVCSECTFRENCREFALSNNILIGVWGGLTGPELQRASESCDRV